MRTITNRAQAKRTTCTIDRSETWIANPGLELQSRLPIRADRHPDLTRNRTALRQGVRHC